MEINEIELKVTITAAKAGKQSAFNVLLDAYWNFVYGYQLKRVQNEHEAEDITIEAFAKAFDKIEGFNEDYVFSTWLITISKTSKSTSTASKNNPLLWPRPRTKSCRCIT